MLRANVGLSRKVTKDFNSTGFSVNLDGEITAPPSDAEAVIEQVKELFDLAEEALDRQIERAQGNDAIGSRDQEHAQTAQPGNGHANGNGNGTTSRSNGEQKPQTEEAATNKQVQFLLTIGKRIKFSTQQLENRIAEIIGRRCGVYDLTKREAGLVLNELTNGVNGKSRQAS